MEKNKYQRLQQGKSLRYVCNNTATNREQGEIITPQGLKEIFLSKNIMATAIKNSKELAWKVYKLINITIKSKK